MDHNAAPGSHPSRNGVLVHWHGVLGHEIGEVLLERYANTLTDK